MVLIAGRAFVLHWGESGKRTLAISLNKHTFAPVLEKALNFLLILPSELFRDFFTDVKEWIWISGTDMMMRILW